MYENKTYENIKRDILNSIKNIDNREGSFTNDMASPVSLEFEKAYKQFDVILGVAFLEDAVGDYVDKKADEHGLYRKKGSKASTRVTWHAFENTVIPKGSICGTKSGLLYETLEQVTIGDGQTQASVEIRALETGKRYNVSAGAINQIPVQISGVSSVSNPKNLYNGVDKETSQELVNRTLFKLRNPATSGNKNHYKMWTLEVDGVGDARVFPIWQGPGTVLVMPLTNDRKAPDSSTIEKVKANIEENRPIGADVTVKAPTEVPINVRVIVNVDGNLNLDTLKSAYEISLSAYILESVLKGIVAVDYFKCLSLMYEIKGVLNVVDFKINNGTNNINIGEREVQVTGSVTLVGGD